MIWWKIKYLSEAKDHGYGYWRNFWCRLIGHTDVWWFNAVALEPNMRCSRCNEDLG